MSGNTPTQEQKLEKIIQRLGLAFTNSSDKQKESEINRTLSFVNSLPRPTSSENKNLYESIKKQVLENKKQPGGRD